PLYVKCWRNSAAISSLSKPMAATRQWRSFSTGTDCSTAALTGFSAWKRICCMKRCRARSTSLYVQISPGMKTNNLLNLCDAVIEAARTLRRELVPNDTIREHLCGTWMQDDSRVSFCIRKDGGRYTVEERFSNDV